MEARSRTTRIHRARLARPRARGFLSVAVLLLLLLLPPVAHAGDVGAGYDFGVWLKDDGTVWTWGEGYSGELGNGTSGTTGHSYVPVQVQVSAGTALTGVTAISVGGSHVVAKRSDGTLWGWGSGSCGRLAQGNTTSQTYAVQLMESAGVPLTGVADFSASDYATLLAMSDGRLLVTGSYPGTGSSGCSTGYYPVQATYASGTPISTAVKVGGTDSSHLVVLSNGTAWAWGSNLRGKLGVGDTTTRYYPTQMLTAAGTPVTGVTEAEGGAWQSFVIRSDGTSWGAGYDGYGEIGNTSVSGEVLYLARTESSAGVALTNVVRVEPSRQQHVLFRRSDNTIWATGQYLEGQQGNGGACCSSPKQVQTGFTAMDGGWMFSVWLRSDGVAFGSGWNVKGEAGSCNTIMQLNLVQIGACSSPPSAPLRPVSLSQKNADGSSMRYNSTHGHYWTSSGVTDNVLFTWTNSDPDASQTLTPRLQLATTATTYTPREAACSTIGTAEAALATTTAYESAVSNATRTGLVHGSIYHWRVCTIDQGGLGSGWVKPGSPWDYESDPNFGVDTVLPAAPTSVVDGNPGDDDWTTSATSLTATYAGATDADSGVWGVSYCVTTSSTGTDCSSGALRTWTSVSSTGSWTASSLTLVEGTTYYMCAKSEDYATNVSSTFVCSDGIISDRTAATNPTTRNDGTGADIDLVTSATTLDGNWTAGSDTLSGVASYDFCFTTSSTGSDCASTATRTWTNTALLAGQATGLTLVHGTRYYLCVRTRDAAGNVAAAACSDGAIYDANAPTATLVSPADLATSVTTSPTLTATYADADADTGTIDFQVCSTSTCSAVARSGSSASVASGSNGSWTVGTPLAGSTTYWWRARSTDVLGRVGAWSAIRSFTTVNAPTITDNQAGDATWRNSNSGTYDVDFSDGAGLANFETNAWSAAGQTGTQRQAWTQVATLSGLSYTTNWALLSTTWTALGEGINYVSVRVTNTSTMTTTSVDTFEVRKDTVAPPAVTTLAAPSPTLVAPALSWTTVTDATSGVAYYRVYRATSSTGPWTQISTNGSPTTGSYTDSAATIGQTHWYKVQAVDLAGNEAAASNTVSVLYHRAPTVALVSPADGSALQPTAPTLTATHSDLDGHAGTITFEVCSDSLCSSVVRTGSSASTASGANGSWTVSPDLAVSTQYWWRARTVDTQGASSGWTSTWTFTTQDGPLVPNARGWNYASNDWWRDDKNGGSSCPAAPVTFENEFLAIDEDIDFPVSGGCVAGAGAPEADVVQTAAATGTYVDRYELSNAPSSMRTLSSVNLRVRGVKTGGKTTTVLVRLYDYSNTLLGTSGPHTLTSTETSFSTTIGSLTHYATDVDGMWVELQGDISGGGQASDERVTAINVDFATVTSTTGGKPTAPTLVSPASAALTNTTPVLSATFQDPDAGNTGTIRYELCADAACAGPRPTWAGTSASGIAIGANGTWSTPALTIGTTYWWRARGRDNSGNEGAWSAWSSFTVDGPPAAPASVNDGTGADVDWTNSTTQLSANWSSVADSDLNRYEYCISATTNCGGTPIVGWTSTALVTSMTSSALSLVNGTTYFVCVRTIDNQTNVSTTNTCADGITVDATLPVAPASVADGTGADITWNTSSTSLSANWPAGSDAASGVQNYDYCISTSSTGADCASTAVVGYTAIAALTFTRTGLALTNGWTYYACVRTRDVAGNVSGHTCSNGQTVDTVAPTAPTTINDGTGADSDLQASGTQLAANWSGATAGTSGIAGYDYCFSTSATGVDCATTATVAWTTQGGTTVTRTGLALTSGSTYYVCVRTLDNAGRVSGSACSDGIVVDSVPPPAVTTLAAPSPTLVAPALSWTTVTDATSGVAYYRVYRAASSTGPWSQISTDGSPTTGAYTDSLATVGQTHWYKVQAVDQAGNEAAASNVISVLYHRAPATPTLVSPADTATGVALAPTLTATYSDPDAHSGTVSFEVCADSACTSIVRSGTSASVSSGVNAAWSVTPSLASNTTYWWRAMATDVNGAVSAWTATWSFTTVNAPSIIDNQSGDLTWRNANSATYDVDFTDGVALASFETNVWSGAGQSGTQHEAWTQVAAIGGTSYTTNWALLASTWTALAEGVNYVSVRVTNSSALSTTSVDTFEVRKDTVAAPAVTTLAAVASPTIVAPALTWTTVADATSGVAYYRIYRAASSTGPWTQISTDGSPTTGSFSDTAALVDATHWYKVQAVDQAGNEAAASNTVSVYYHRAPNPATLVTPMDAATGVSPLPTLTATHSDPDAHTGTLAFEVCSDSLCSSVVRSGSSAAGIASGSNGSHTISSALASGTQYWWRARSTDQHGAVGAWSVIWSFTTANTPTIIDNQSGDLTWRNANSGLYDVDFTDGVALASFETNVWSAAGQTGIERQVWTQVAAIGGTSYTTNWALLASTWTALAEGVNYVSVRVTNSSALSTTSVDTFEVRKDTVAAPAVTTLAAVASPTIVAPALTWTTVTDATSGVAFYRVYRGSSSTGPWTLASTDGTVTTGSFSDTAALVDATHWYKVQAVDQAGNEAAASNTVSVYYHRAPNPATLITPVDAATGISPLATLTATHSDPDSHTGTLAFEVCSDSLCSSVVRSGSSASGIASGSNGSWTVSSSLAQGTQYWWRARSTDQHGAVGTWSVIWSFTTSTGPTITDNQLGDATWRSTNSGSYDVDFSDALGLDRFEVQVWSGAGQTGTLLENWTLVVGSLAGTSYATNWALPASTWTAMGEGVNYVSVRAYNDAAGVSSLVDVFEVRKDTAAAAPGTVNDGPALDVDWWASTSSLDMNWTASTGEVGFSGVLRYEYCISTLAACGGTVARSWSDAGVGTSVTAAALSLVDGTQYFVSMRMVDVAGNTSAATSSDAFRVDASAPTAPALVTPLDAATITASPTLTATYNDPAPASPGQLSFELCSDSSCSTVVQSGTSTSGIAAGSDGSWTPTPLAGGSYWWRARGTDSAGTTGVWSSIRAFTLTYPPTAPTPISPTDAGWVATATPTLTATFHDPDAGASGQLSFELCSDSACLSVVETGASAAGVAAGSNGSWTTSAIANGATRWWRVRGNDGTSSGPWSSIWSVRVDIQPPPAVTTLAAASPTNANPALTWTTVADAESGTSYYRVYRSTTAGVLGTQINVDGATTTGSYTDASAPGTGTYHYTVQAVDAVGNEQTAGNNQVSVEFIAPLYLRANAAGTLTGGWTIETTPGSAANTATKPKVGQGSGYVQFEPGLAPAAPVFLATLPGSPTGAGWIYEQAAGSGHVAGSWRFHVTTNASRNHSGFLNVRAWKVTTSAGAIQTSTPLTNWVQGTTDIGAVTTDQQHFVDVAMPQVSFAAGEHLYVEYWENITVAASGGGSNNTTVAFQVDTTAERIEPTGPIPPMSVTSTTPASLAQGRRDVVVRINGSGFVSGATVAFSGTGINIDSTTWVSASAIDVQVDIAGAATLGTRSVTVTNPDTSTATGTDIFTVVAPSISIGFSTLGYADATRDTTAPHLIAFGAMTSASTREIGPATSGQTLAGAAIETTVTSDTDTILQVTSTDWSDGATNTMPAGSLALKHYGIAEAWTPLATTATTIDGPTAPATTTYAHDLRLTIPAAQPAAAYSATVTYTALAAP